MPADNDRYRLHAYVCSASCVQREFMLEGSVTFTWIYQNRPKDCRYAVVSDWDIDTHANRYLVWDLYGVTLNTSNGHLTGGMVTPEPRLTHTDLDAVIMATVLLYNKETKRC